MSAVLVCEDDAAIGGLMLTLLRRSGFECEWIGGGLAAINRLRAEEFGAVILDLMMSEGSGYDVIDWMRSESPSLLSRVIVVTAAASALKSDLRHEVRTLLLKPFELGELLDAVRACLREHEPP